MANTYTLISSNVLSSAAASVTFSSIPATYTDLLVRMSVRSSSSVTDFSLALKPNGSTANDTSTWITGNGSAASSSRSTVDFGMGRASGNSATANTFGSLELYIPNYAGSTNKPMSAFGAAETNATAVEMRANAMLWSNTAAITSLEITTDGVGNFVADSSFYLFGIKNS